MQHRIGSAAVAARLAAATRLAALVALATLPALAADPALAAPPDRGRGERFTPDWTGVEAEFFPLAPAGTIQPVLTADDVTDAAICYFVADPFLVFGGDIWHLFFEVAVPSGKIAHATSPDGLTWSYDKIVLSESFQQSYPSIFEWNGDYWMTPESTARSAVRLYRATPFPDSWTYVGDLVTGRLFADPQLFRYDGRWWMFVGNGASDMCWLYWSDQLESGWTEHPASPIVAGNRGRARPGGRTIVLSDNRVYRLAQNSSPTYGRALRVFQVDVLTTASYAEHEVVGSPILQASGSGWNADGMHQCDPWWVGDHWIAAVDGQVSGDWSIGIYRTASIATAATSPETAARLQLGAAPNPAPGTTSFDWAAPARGVARAAELCIYDPAGRLVLSRAWRVIPGERGQFTWNGTDATGRRVAAGTYFCTLRTGASATTARVVLLR